MYGWKRFLLRNWHLKLVSLALATALWVGIAREANSEISVRAPLEYINVPSDSEMTGETAETVEVWLRGPSALVREVSPKDVSITVDLANMAPGEKIVPLIQSIHVPFGLSVARVAPSRVRIELEKTVSKPLPVVAVIQGRPAEGFHIVKTTVRPDVVQVLGPESRLAPLEKVDTRPINVGGRQQGKFAVNVELELTEPLVRLTSASPVRVELEIERGR